jgi:hypothetical protein
MLFRRRKSPDKRRHRVRSDAWGTSLSGGQPRQWQWGSDTATRPVQRWSRNYGQAEFIDEQPRLTDYVPRRLVAFALLLILGAGAVAGLTALHVYAHQSARWASGAHLAAFDLAVRGSVGTWFSSMLLAAAALTSLVVYSVRRFKADDCRGHYRVWLWAAVCWLLMSVDTTAGLHHAFAAAMVSLTGARLLGDGSIWWVVGYGFLLGGVGTRLLVDMRSCRLSAAGLLLALGCYAAAVAALFGCVELPAGIDPTMAIPATVLAGNLLVLLAVGLHARHVILDAHGLLPSATRDPPLATSHPSPVTLTVHPPQGIPAPNVPIYDTRPPLNTAALFHPVDAEPPATSPHPLTSGWPNGPVTRKLTKQEKKALRERLERMRHQREARAG